VFVLQAKMANAGRGKGMGGYGGGGDLAHLPDLPTHMKLELAFHRSCVENNATIEEKKDALKALASRLDLVLVKPDKLVKNQTFQSGSGTDKAEGKKPIKNDGDLSASAPAVTQVRKSKGPGPGELQPGQTPSWKKDSELIALQKQFRDKQLEAEAERDVDAKAAITADMAAINAAIRAKKEELRAAKAAQGSTSG
jgi:hypothetical protein